MFVSLKLRQNMNMKQSLNTKNSANKQNTELKKQLQVFPLPLSYGNLVEYYTPIFQGSMNELSLLNKKISKYIST